MTNRAETIVFDTKPLLAYLRDEPGSDKVETYIKAIPKDVNGYISSINRTEIHYLSARVETADRADAVIEILEENGIRTVDFEKT